MLLLCLIFIGVVKEEASKGYACGSRGQYQSTRASDEHSTDAYREELLPSIARTSTNECVLQGKP